MIAATATIGNPLLSSAAAFPFYPSGQTIDFTPARCVALAAAPPSPSLVETPLVLLLTGSQPTACTIASSLPFSVARLV